MPDREPRDVLGEASRNGPPQLKGRKQMKLTPKTTPYSSIVGGGITLVDDHGVARFMILFTGTTAGISKEQTEALARQIMDLITEAGGIKVPSPPPDTVKGEG